tara:strand:- start:6856 stop:8463 length:1608 start_codon:yes stop_codon:yes gene_type:complete
MDSEVLGSLSVDSNAADDVNKTTDDVDYFIDPTGDDTTGDGSSGNPWATLQKAWDTLPEYIENEVIITAAAGTYFESEEILNGKTVVTGGSILVDGNKTAEGIVYTATGGLSLNANGLGEITVAAAGWGVNEHQGRFVRIVTHTSPSTVISVKYLPISSNTATTLVTPYLIFTPDGNTTFDIVNFDSIFTSSTSGAPTVGVNIPITFGTNTSITGLLDTNDGLYVRSAITLDGLHVKNSAASNPLVKVNRSEVLFRGIQGSSDVTVNAHLVSAGLAGSKVSVIGAKTEGQVGGVMSNTNGATGTAFTVLADMTTSTYSQRYIALADVRGWTFMDSFYAFGDAGNMILGMMHSDGAGSNGFINQGRVEFATSFADSGKNSYLSVSTTDGVYGNNVTNMYTSREAGVIKANAQSNVTYTNKYNVDSESFVIGNDGFVGMLPELTTVNAASADVDEFDNIVHVTYTTTGVVALEMQTSGIEIERKTWIIKDADGNASVNNITISTEGAETIDGAATAVISGDYDSIRLYSDGSDLFIK